MVYSDPDRARAQSSIANLLKTDLLTKSLKASQSYDVGSREQVKGLLLQGKNQPSSKLDCDSERLAQAHKLLVEDFLSQRSELNKLNRARKIQLEEHFSRMGKPIGFEALVSALPGSREHGLLLLLAEQHATFYLTQILLLRRWAEMDLLPLDQLQNSARSANWKITGVLKKKCPQQMIQRDEWNFLKANIFSWYMPQASSLERVHALLFTKNLNAKALFFLPLGLKEQDAARGHLITQLLLQQIGEKKNISLLGSFDSALLFQLLLAQSFGLIFKLQVEAANEFDQYMAELFALWANSPQLPKFVSRLDKSGNSVSPARQAQLDPSHRMALEVWDAVVFSLPSDSQHTSLPQVLQSMDLLIEGGILLMTSDSFWPTESHESHKRFRDAITRSAAIHALIDARQLVNTQIPRCLSFLRRCSNKEQRDTLRTHILRLKGDGTNIASISPPLLNLLQKAPEAGEQLQALSENGIRVESMVSACLQGELRASPWTMLADQSFFEIATHVRRATQRVFDQGGLSANQSQLVEAPQRCIHLIEIPGQGLLSSQSVKGMAIPDSAKRFLYVPDPGTLESIRFFSAWFNSSLIQFWYRLERDQASSRGRGQEKTSEKLLKFAPVQRLKLRPRENAETIHPFLSAEECQKNLHKIWQVGGELTADWAIHDWILATDSLLEKKISGLREIIRHLYPNLALDRWNIPQDLPALEASHAFKALLHLPHAPVTQHPAVQITGTRGKDEFRIQELNTVEHGPVAELTISGDKGQRLMVSGSSLYVRAINERLFSHMGHNAMEALKCIELPLDAKLVLSQVEQFQELIKIELKGVHQIVRSLNLVFCKLAGLTCSLEDGAQADLIERFVSPPAKPHSISLAAARAKEAGFAGTKANQ